MTDKDPQLSALRGQIDAIDDKLAALLLERINIVGQVGDHKQKQGEKHCPIRPGREAEMVRRIMDKFEGTAFSPAAAASLWRIIIGTSTATEFDMRLSVFAQGNDSDLCWLAREYFGPAVPVTRQPHAKRVIGDVMDGKLSVGIVPVLRGGSGNDWWTSLLQQGAETPRIFARIPFVHTDTPGKDTVSGLAIARVAPEASGDDVSLIVLEAEHNVSQNRMQSEFAVAKLEANWIDVATITPQTRHHLLEVKGFVDAEHSGMKSFLAAMNSSIQRTHFLGSYAAPVILAAEKKTESKKSNAAGSA